MHIGIKALKKHKFWKIEKKKKKKKKNKDFFWYFL